MSYYVGEFGITILTLAAISVAGAFGLSKLVDLFSRLCPGIPKLRNVAHYNGKWKSRIYEENEKGSIEIDLLALGDEEIPCLAKVKLVYDASSDFKPEREETLEFSCDYIEQHKVYKTYRLLQLDPIDTQYFVIHFDKKITKQSVGYMVCVGPADLCEITFEPKQKSKKE